jgi:hydrogenase maturation protease
MKTLVLGIGNPILTDDGVGIEIARRIEQHNPDVVVEETNEAAIALLDLVMDYERLIIIDSIMTEDGQPGKLYKLGLEDFSPKMDFMSAHGMDIATAFEVGRGIGCRLPQSVSIYAVEVKDNSNFSESCTPELAARIAPITQKIIAEEKL